MTRAQSKRRWMEIRRIIASAPPHIYAYRVADTERRCKSVRLSPEEAYLFACFCVVGAHRIGDDR